MPVRTWIHADLLRTSLRTLSIAVLWWGSWGNCLECAGAIRHSAVNTRPGSELETEGRRQCLDLPHLHMRGTKALPGHGARYQCNALLVDRH